MPLEADKVYSNKHVRLFFQFNGPQPNRIPTYYGTNAQFAMVDGLQESFGTINPVNVRAPFNQEGYVQVGRTLDAPDLPTANLTLMEKIGYVSKNLGNRCPFNLYLPVGECGNLADPLNGWSYLTVLAGAIPEGRDRGARLTHDSGGNLSNAYTLKLFGTYDVGQLAFGEFASAQVDTEVIDVVYGGGRNCGDCGPLDDGTSRLYAATYTSGSGSPGLQAEVVYVRRDPETGDITTYQYPLTYLSAGEEPSFIDIIGNYLVVGSNDAGSIGYAEIDPVTGTLGSFTEMTTGIVASAEPNDIHVTGPFEAFIVGDGGYVYKMTDPKAGVTVLSAGGATSENLNRIHGSGNTLVAVGANAAVIYSTNRGASWAATSADPGAADLTAVAVKGPFHWWAGGASRYYTLDGGVSWIEQAVAGASSIRDIVFPTDEVGYTLYNTASAARLQATVFGGALWADSVNANSRMRGWPSSGFAHANRVAHPTASVAGGVAFLAAGGRAGAAGTDGVLQIGIESQL
jgi:hypothetical protein